MAKTKPETVEEVLPKTVVKTKKKSKSKSSKKKTKKVKKTSPKKTPSPAPAPAPAPEPVPEQTTVSEPKQTTVPTPDPIASLDDTTIDETIASVVTRMTELMAQMKALQSTVKGLTKLVKKERQAKSKKLNRTLNELRKKTNKKRKPSGLAKPTLLSNSLCDFLDLPHKSEEARTSVTKKINAYIAANNLQNPDKKKEILPDDKLEGILQTGGQVLTYTNLQTFLNKHFANKSNPVPVADQ